MCKYFSIYLNACALSLSLSGEPTTTWQQARVNAGRAGSSLLTLAAGALAAVDDGQHHGLAVAARAAQAQETHRGVGVQAVAAALAHRLQVRLLQTEERGKLGGYGSVGEDESTEEEKLMQEEKLQQLRL